MRPYMLLDMQKMTNTKTKVLPPLRVSDDEDSEIRRRAAAAAMPLAKYMRDRCLGKTCAPVNGNAKRTTSQ